MTTKSKPFGANLKATNTDSLVWQFDQRTAYSVLHPYLYDEEMPIPINFWGPNNGFYGRMDSDKDFISPKESQMKQINDLHGKDVYVLNFVADAFEDFAKFLKIKKANKLLADDNFTLDWNAKRGWFDIEAYRQQFIEQLMDSFVNQYLETTGKHKEITGFDSFLKIFLDDYLDAMVISFPFTKTGLLHSKYYSPMASGLCVEISTANHGDDEQKYFSFINNANFKLYCLAASKFGFLIDKNAPWRLVANLNSYAMKEYIAKRLYVKGALSGTTETSVSGHSHTYEYDNFGNGKTTSIIQGNQAVVEHEHTITKGTTDSYNSGIANHGHIIVKPTPNPNGITPEHVYQNFYDNSSLMDIELLRGAIILYYNEYIANYPSVTVPEVCASFLNSGRVAFDTKINLKSKTRKKISAEQVSEKYPPVFWLKTLFKIRLKELKVPIEKVNLDYNLKKIMIIDKSVDFLSAFLYAQKYLKQYY